MNGATNVVLSEGRQAQKDRWHTISQVESKLAEATQAERRKGRGKREVGHGYQVSVMQDDKF